MTYAEAEQEYYDENALTDEDEGYQKSLKPRQIQMIGMGGAIGTGLFLGVAGRLNHAGPSLFVVYGICGIFVFFVLRALGELVLHRPSSGSFVSYAREFMGEKAAFAAGWLYFLNWAFTGIVDSTAVALYFHYWGAFSSVPQWLIAFIALTVIVAMNLISVKLFGEIEFWAAIVKVTALSLFIIIGVVYLVGRFHYGGHVAGTANVTQHGGWLPTGAWQVVLVGASVVFAFGGTELVGTAAGETEDPHKSMPRAINSVIGRIAIFYVGSMVLLALLLPHTNYQAGTSPFVSFFSSVGLSGIGTVMNLVVITAALSSLNAGVYSTGRILRSMSSAGSAPRVLGNMTGNGVPYGGILLTASIGYLGVVLNAFAPGRAFDIVLNLSSLGIIAAWGTIVLAHLFYMNKVRRGLLERGDFRMPFAPVSNVLVLAFLVAILVITGFDTDNDGQWTVGALVVIVPALIIGWFLARKRVRAVAEERVGFTGKFPVIAERPRHDPAGGSASRPSPASPAD